MKNNARTTVVGTLTAGITTLTCKTGEGALFGSSFPYYATLEYFLNGVCTIREIITITNRSGDVFTFTRASQTCVQDESATTKTRTAVAKAFATGPIFLSEYMTETDIDNINTNINAKLPLAGGQLTGNLKLTKATTLASAGTVGLGTATGNYVEISGTTTITSFGTNTAGNIYFVRFQGALTLTHNGTSLILPTGANITTVAGDNMTIIGEGGSNWRVLSYNRASGQSVGSVSIPDGDTTTKGIVQRATVAEAEAKTDTTRYMTPETTSASIKNSIQDPISRAINTDYLADTNGIVIGGQSGAQYSSATTVEILGFVGTSNPATTRIAGAFSINDDLRNRSTTVCFPVKKGQYYRVTGNVVYGGGGNPSYFVNFYPLS